jgi:LL-H family phage holin
MEVLFMDIIQPYIVPVLQALVGLLVTILIAAVVSLRQKINTWVESRTTAAQRESLHKFSLEAFAFAETVFKDSNGPEKLTAAYGYLSRRAKENGIKIDEAEIRAIIEKSVLDFNAGMKSKDGGK